MVRMETNVTKEILKTPPVYTSKGGSRKKSAYSFKNCGFSKVMEPAPQNFKSKMF